MINMIHLGTGAFDEISGEVVDTTAFVMSSSFDKEYRSTFDKLVEYTDEKTKRDFLNKKRYIYCKAK